MHLKFYLLLLIIPLLAGVATLTEQRLVHYPDQMSITSMMTSSTNQMMSTTQMMSETSMTSTVIPGFPVESIGAGLILGLFIILLLRMTTKFGWSLIKRR
jgi:hypothetical protein